MQRLLWMAMCASMLLGCGDDGGNAGSSSGEQTYCEVNCGCAGRLGAPASIVRDCVDACSQTGGDQFDACPPEVAAFRDCLYATSNCDTGQCLDELNSLTDCVFGQ